MKIKKIGSGWGIVRLVLLATVFALGAAACSSGDPINAPRVESDSAPAQESDSAPAQESAAPVLGIDAVVPAAGLGPDGVIGQGPNGESAASLADLALTDDEIQQAKDGGFEVGIVMHVQNLDWSKLQINGITATLAEFGIEVVAVTDAGFLVEEQIADIEDMIQIAPDAVISIPVDDTATAPAYKQIAEAGIKLVFMDNVPRGLEYPTGYQSMISADSQGNGAIAAEVLAEYVPDGGKIGIIEFGIDFFVTNERVIGVENWLGANRSDINVLKADFLHPDDALATAENFLTKNPDLDGLFVVWDAPAMDAVAAARTLGMEIPITTIDLGLEVALNMAQGGLIKGLGAQRPYDQGVAEAYAVANSLLGKETPAWVGVLSLPVTPDNVMEAYREVFKQDPPQELRDACAANAGCTD